MSIVYSRTALMGPRPVLPARTLATLVIRTYNEAAHLPSVLDAVAVQQISSGQPVEVLVVDSGSQDGTDTLALERGARVLRIAKETFSYSRALNLGCEAAGGEFVVMISGHCIPTNHAWLEELLHPFRDPSVAATYGRQVGHATTKFSEARVYEKYYPPHAASQGAAFCNNANAAVRKSIWRRFRYDEELTGLEDIEMGQRIIRAGFRMAYCPQAVVTHIHDETWPQVRRRYEREAIALRHIHPELHLNALEAASCFVSAVWKDACTWASTSRSWQHLAQIVPYRFNQFVGSWLGSRAHRELSKQEKLRYFFPA